MLTTNIVPTSGPKGGGTTVLLRGINFGNSSSARCRFNSSILGVIEGPATFLSGSKIQCVTPPHSQSGGATQEGLLGISVKNYGSFWSTYQTFMYTATDLDTTSTTGLTQSVPAGTVGTFTIVARTTTGATRVSGGDSWYLNFERANTNKQPTYGIALVDMDHTFFNFDTDAYSLLDYSAGLNALTLTEIQNVESSSSLPGRYTVMFKTTISGSYNMAISNAPFSSPTPPPGISDSPLSITVQPLAIDLTKTAFTGSMMQEGVTSTGELGLGLTEAGILEDLLIRAADVYGNYLGSNVGLSSSPTTVVFFYRCSLLVCSPCTLTTQVLRHLVPPICCLNLLHVLLLLPL